MFIAHTHTVLCDRYTSEHSPSDVTAVSRGRLRDDPVESGYIFGSFDVYARLLLVYGFMSFVFSLWTCMKFVVMSCTVDELCLCMRFSRCFILLYSIYMLPFRCW